MREDELGNVYFLEEKGNQRLEVSSKKMTFVWLSEIMGIS